MKLHIFNPEHDLALAANLRQFTAPHAGRQLRSDLSFIPALWADEGDLVLVDDIDNARDKVRHLGTKLVDKVEFITKVQLEHLIKTEFLDSVHPWGWDLSLKGELERIGMPEIVMPGDAILNKVRALSSRQWTAEHLQSGVQFVQTVTDVKSLVREWGKAVIKAPWSSSGRGVRFVSADEFREGGSDYPSFERWVGNIIYRQGGVTVEPYYNKVMDFGMEFEMVDGNVLYRGLSLFDTIKNAYSGNILCSEDKKEEMMAQYVSPERLLQIRQHIIDVMEPALKGNYSGPFGVDMMIYAKDMNALNQVISTDMPSDFGVNECIEVNLRRTMGHVAIDLANYLQQTSAEFNNIMRVDFDGNRYHLRVMPGQPSEDAPFH